jgi:hypothetical protein
MIHNYTGSCDLNSYRGSVRIFFADAILPIFHYAFDLSTHKRVSVDILEMWCNFEHLFFFLPFSVGSLLLFELLFEFLFLSLEFLNQLPVHLDLLLHLWVYRTTSSAATTSRLFQTFVLLTKLTD